MFVLSIFNFLFYTLIINVLYIYISKYKSIINSNNKKKKRYYVFRSNKNPRRKIDGPDISVPLVEHIPLVQTINKRGCTVKGARVGGTRGPRENPPGRVSSSVARVPARSIEKPDAIPADLSEISRSTSQVHQGYRCSVIRIRFTWNEDKCVSSVWREHAPSFPLFPFSSRRTLSISAFNIDDCYACLSVAIGLNASLRDATTPGSSVNTQIWECLWK